MKQLNNKTLAIILVVLVAAFILTKAVRSPLLESNVKTNLFALDTTGVTEIQIYPKKQQGKEIRLIRNGKLWEVAQEQKSSDADQGVVRDLLGSLAYVGVQRMVARKKKDWDDYEVGDTSGTHVKVYVGSKVLTDFWIGSNAAGNGLYGQSVSYIRLSDHPDVYESSAGNLASYFNKTYDEWRSHVFLRVDKSKITKINFQYSADSSFAVAKKDSAWMIGNQRADSAKMENYLNGLHSKNLYSFVDNFSPVTHPDAVITIENGASALAVIKGWKNAKNWVLTSTFRKGIYFSDKASDAVKNLLVGKRSLLQK